MSADDLLAKAHKVAPLLAKHADDNEQLGRLGDPVVATLHDTGMFGMWVPKELGGSELDPIQSLDLISALSYSDGATGWVVMAVGVANATSAAYLPDETVKKLFSGDRFPVIAGQGVPNGISTPKGDGYEVSGRWSYGSGILHADYTHSGTIVHEGGAPRLDANGQPEIRIVVVPTTEVQLDGNWDVLGLRATGSVDYAIEPRVVSSTYTHRVDETVPLRGGPFFHLGAVVFAAIGHSGFALGIGRRVLDEVATFAWDTAQRPVNVASSESFQEDYARAEARFRSARAFVYEVWEDAWDAVHGGTPLTTRQITLLRLALNNVTFAVVEISTFAYKAGGGEGAP
jgi:alkylation response protein AidB-like acyl-CoA dehydrogenase